MPGHLAVVILAAGKSTRFKSQLTKTLHEVAGKPLVEHVFDAALTLEPAQIVVVYGAHSAQLTARYEGGYRGHNVHLALQDPPLGTGHALLQAEPLLFSSVSDLLVLTSDTPLVTGADLLPLLAARRPGTPHALLSGHCADPTGYGRILRDEADVEMVSRIVEESDANEAEKLITEVNSGMYLFGRRVFDDLRESAKVHGASAVKGEYYLPDVVRVAPTAVVQSADFSVLEGVNDRLQLSRADTALQKRIREQWMREGVTFLLPETSYIGADVQLAPDVEVGPGCVLLGATTVGRGTRFVQGCHIQHCEIGAGCTLHYVRAELAKIGDGISAGPFANLRAGTTLHDGVRVGNFVETKKAEVGAGSKLPHLTYVGDATLGAGVNIGAGTIFCNYDGTNKQHTTVGDGVFVGSNSSLQAPLTIGDGAYIAMASAITHDVPADALAVARARQENKDGYAKKLRRKKNKVAGEDG
jgi:bifunctional UDP-N-acetylglucosamine pyrophosphorylase/glucosamine-1-phosphate N-acetyltransferase